MSKKIVVLKKKPGIGGQGCGSEREKRHRKKNTESVGRPQEPLVNLPQQN